MKNRKFSKTGLVLVGSMVVCLLICLAVVIPKGGIGGDAAEDLNDADTPDLKTVMNEGSPILIYDKRPEAQALLAAYEAGQLESVRIETGDKDEITADTPAETRELYRMLKNIVVTGEAEAPEETADAKTTTLTFELTDGTECAYTLVGESLLAIGDVNKQAFTEGEAALLNAANIAPLLKQIKETSQ